MLRNHAGRAIRSLYQRDASATGRMSTVVRESSVAGVGLRETKHEKEMFVFPWIRQEVPVLTTEQRTAKNSLWKRSMLLLRSQISLEIIRHYLSHPGMETMSSTCGIHYMDPRGGEFLTGARQAFTVCSNTIFKGSARAPVDEAMLDSAFEAEEAAAAAASIFDKEKMEMRNNADMEEGQGEMNHTFDASGTPVPRSHPASKSSWEKQISTAAETFHSLIHGSKESEKRDDGVAPPIEYAGAWNKANQPPSARFASGALNDVVDNKLAAFFEEALQGISKMHNLHHVLHQVYMPSISHCEITFNAQRGFNFDLIKRHYIFGVIGAAVLGDPPQKSAGKTRGFGGDSTDIGSSSGGGEQLPNHMHAFSQADQQKPPEQMSPPTFTLNSREMSEWLELPQVQRAKSELKKMAHLATIRVHVNLPCKETFFVSEKESGLIVQGDCIPKDSTHQIVLEGSFSVKDMNFPEFHVVDIDNWLEGNRFV